MFFCFSFWFYSKFVLEKAKKHATLHGKPYFLFPDVLKRWSFQKNCAGIWSFLYYWERWYFYFPKIWSYPQTENERWSFSKKYTEIWYFLQTFWKDGLFKRAALGYDISCIVWKDGIFSPKTWHFFLGQKVRDDLPQEIHRNMIFSVNTYECYKRGATPLCQKNQRRSYPTKIYLKVIDVLDWHPRKSCSNSLYFHGGPYRRFHVPISSEKNEET